MPVHFRRSAPPGFRAIEQEEPAEAGDHYFIGQSKFTVGEGETIVKVGEPWPAHLIVHSPIRRKTPR